MDDQNSTEKSVGFFSLSVIIHALVVFGILAGAAYRATQGGGSKGDSETVTMEMVDSSGDAEQTPAQVEAQTQNEITIPLTPKVETKSEEKPQPTEKAQPVKAAAIVAKPETKKSTESKTNSKQAAAVSKIKSSPKAIPTETQESEDAPEVNASAATAAAKAATPVEEEATTDAAEDESAEQAAAPAAATTAAATQTQKTKSTEEDIDKEEHQMPAAAAIPARPATEATAQTEPAATTTGSQQAAHAEETATVTQGNGNGEGAAKGDGSGATPADAKDFADLKQKPGNRPPKYPLNARRAKLEGQVELTYFVSKQGFVEQVKVAKSSGSAALDHEAMQAIQNYKYFPGQEGWASHPVTFSLQGDAQQVGGLRH